MTERTLATVARALEARADQPGVFSGYSMQLIFEEWL
jgi:hypothetical protein